MTISSEHTVCTINRNDHCLLTRWLSDACTNNAAQLLVQPDKTICNLLEYTNKMNLNSNTHIVTLKCNICRCMYISRGIYWGDFLKVERNRSDNWEEKYFFNLSDKDSFICGIIGIDKHIIIAKTVENICTRYHISTFHTYIYLTTNSRI